MAITDSGVSRMTIRELENLLQRRPNCRYKNQIIKELKAKKGRERQLHRNGGKQKAR